MATAAVVTRVEVRAVVAVARAAAQVFRAQGADPVSAAAQQAFPNNKRLQARVSSVARRSAGNALRFIHVAPSQNVASIV